MNSNIPSHKGHKSLGKKSILLYWWLCVKSIACELAKVISACVTAALCCYRVRVFGMHAAALLNSAFSAPMIYMPLLDIIIFNSNIHSLSSLSFTSPSIVQPSAVIG